MSQAIVEDTEIQATAEKIAGTLQQAYDILIKRRDTAYKKAIAPLDAVRDALVKEHSAIGERARNLKALLPARARVSQYEADCLTLEGKREEAELKLKEMKAAENTPRLMHERQQEISARIDAIEVEKRSIARSIFETWYPQCQHLVRAAEHGLFITFLEGLQSSFHEFQDRTLTRVEG